MLLACLSLCKQTIHTSQTTNATLSCEVTWVRKKMISLSNVNDDAMFSVSISFLLHTNCLVSVWSTLRYVNKNRCVWLCMRWVRLPWSSSSSASSCFCIRWRENKQNCRREWAWAKLTTYSYIRSIELDFSVQSANHRSAYTGTHNLVVELNARISWDVKKINWSYQASKEKFITIDHARRLQCSWKY